MEVTLQHPLPVVHFHGQLFDAPVTQEVIVGALAEVFASLEPVLLLLPRLKKSVK